MKKIISGLFVLAITITTVSAQTKSLGNNDPAAKKILDGVTTKFKTFKAVVAKFSLKIENASGKVLGAKSGTVAMKGLKYHVAITGQEIFCDGTNISTFDQSAKEVTITKIDPSSNSLTPQKIFANFYDKDFLYKLNGESKLAGKTLQEIELTPIDKTKAFFKVLVYVDKVTQTITSTKIFEKSGSRYSYSVSSMNTKAIVADDQ
ncbi:MAG: outer membrane lipoprotein carrier protein LolA, partial [Sphingobacteriales bacterium]|nr:outer membrane lipoprotein carrier protein LolA [Sphingobacteriales bacterium]